MTDDGRHTGRSPWAAFAMLAALLMTCQADAHARKPSRPPSGSSAKAKARAPTPADRALAAALDREFGSAGYGCDDTISVARKAGDSFFASCLAKEPKALRQTVGSMYIEYDLGRRAFRTRYPKTFAAAGGKSR